MKNKRKLKIAVFCTNEFSVPPSPKMKDIYAPLWITHYIVEELVKRGHKVTLFASSDSKTKAKLISENLVSLASNKNLSRFYKQVTEIKGSKFYQQLVSRKTTIENYEYLLLSKLSRMAIAKKFDLVYVSLIGLRAVHLATVYKTPTVFTINSPLNSFWKIFFKEYKKRHPQLHFLGISKSQTRPDPDLFSGIVYNGIKIKNFHFNPKPKDYLLISGMIAKEKGIYEAIKIAKRVNKKLIIIGRHTEDEYWRKKIKPLLGKNIQYKGLLPYPEVPKFYENAKAFIFPLQWEEPFGLTMAEAMACGTPVIAFNRGSVKEVVKNGKTGFVVKPFNKNKKTNIDGFVRAIKKIDQIDRKECRKWVKEKFTVEKMVDGYEEVFYKILSREKIK